jgi:N-acyl-D-aspartate/D-glutamate deacylase
MIDLLIRQGIVFDGLGSAPQIADIAVVEGKISRIAPHIKEPAYLVWEAQYQWVLPGFLDIHTHYDLEVELDPWFRESLRHGVTSVVAGNCSLSVMMGAPQDLAQLFLRVETFPRELLEKWLQQSVRWKTPQAYFEHFSQQKLGSNIAFLLGHSALRLQVMGLARSLGEKATPEELEQMRILAKAALEAGCIGISIDMVPWHRMSGSFSGRSTPSHYASYEEYQMLADLCLEQDLVFQVTPNPQNPWSLFRIFRLGWGKKGRPLRLTILTALDMKIYPFFWHFFPLILFIFNRIFGYNIRFQTLTEPFTVYSDGPKSPLFEEFPSGVLLNNEETREGRQKLWRDPAFCKLFYQEWYSFPHATFPRNFENYFIINCPQALWNGKTLTEIAQLEQKEPLVLWMELLERWDTDLRWVLTGANERPQIRQILMGHEFILPGFTDAGAHGRNLAFFDGGLSLLRQAVQTGFMSPQRAIARMTGEPALWFGLDTGKLMEGVQADIVILDPQKLQTPIPPAKLVSDPLLEGAERMVKVDPDTPVQAIFLAGEEVFESGHFLGNKGQKRLGRLLKSAFAPSTGTINTTNRRTKKAFLQYPSPREKIYRHLLDHPFVEYWDIFVLKHQNKWNIFLHLLGVLYFYGVLLGVCWSQWGWGLLLLPFSQLIGLLGHFFFEPSFIDLQDATFSFRASRCLNRLFWKIVTGRYVAELERCRKALKAYQERNQTLWDLYPSVKL